MNRLVIKSCWKPESF